MTAPLYLSRVRLRRSASVGALAPLLLGGADGDRRSRQPGHHLVWSLFADGSGETRDFLWREMERRGAYMILSTRLPVDRHGLFEIDEPKAFTPALALGDRLRFSLRANPVVRRRAPSRSRSARHDVVMDALSSLSADQRAEKRVQAVRERGLAWLDAQAAKAGFLVRPPDVAIDGYRQHRIPRNDAAATMSFSSLDFQGVLEVSEPEAFLAAIRRGFGAAKAYGCGLMLIRRT